MPADGHFGRIPITDGDDAIAAAIEEVSVPSLMMSVVHMTGDPSILRGASRPVGVYLNEVQGFMSPEDQRAVRARALEAIIAYRDSGCVLPPEPGPRLVHEMMNVLVAQEVPEEYVPLMLEELELDGADARDLHWADGIPAEDKEAFHVVVIGAGMSGLLAGIRLAGAGIPFTIVEKNTGVGGTWWENRYPGCRVDVGNHFYCYSFAPNNEWSEFFARQPELQAYFDRCMHDFGIDAHVRFDTEVVRARWDDSSARWSVELRSPAGAVETMEADAVISAVGQLNRPKLPDIPGRDHALCPVGGGHRPPGQAGGGHRNRRQRLPDRAHHRRGRRAPGRVPTICALDVPQSALSRPGRARGPVGLRPPALLRALVPVPLVLAGV
jgi:4-hydroxyacetophenone monooxygenase